MADEDLDTKERLLQAAEELFARDGIHRVPLREINALAGQRNPSALHYHFGSREALVLAILQRHQTSIEEAMAAGIDELERTGEVTIREIVATTIRPLVEKLDTPSGRSFLRLLPQLTPELGRNLRHGISQPSPPQSVRALELLKKQMTHVPVKVQRERQVAYVLILSTLLADRAHLVEAGEEPALDRRQFEDHLVDLVEAALAAPSTVKPSRGRPARRP